MSSRPKVGMSLYTYGADIRRGRMSVREAIEHAASLGVEGIEFVDKQHIPNYPNPSVYDLRELRDYVESLGMKVSCYSTYVDRAIRSDREATEEEMVRMIREQIAVASVLGAEVYRPAIFPKRRADLTPESAFEAHAREMAGMARQVIPELRRYNVKWGSEIHAPMPPEALLNFAKQVNDEYVGLVPDFSVWQTTQALETHVAGGASMESLRAVMPYTIHVHAKAHGFDEDGEEVNTPYREILAVIKESGYDGYISSEFEGWWEGEDFDSRKIAETHVNLIRRYL